FDFSREGACPSQDQEDGERAQSVKHVRPRIVLKADDSAANLAWVKGVDEIVRARGQDPERRGPARPLANRVEAIPRDYTGIGDWPVELPERFVPPNSRVMASPAAPTSAASRGRRWSVSRIAGPAIETAPGAEPFSSAIEA